MAKAISALAAAFRLVQVKYKIVSDLCFIQTPIESIQERLNFILVETNQIHVMLQSKFHCLHVDPAFLTLKQALNFIKMTNRLKEKKITF
jgi:hypothetical protein